jgi:hypothetical protein
VLEAFYAAWDVKVAETQRLLDDADQLLAEDD